MASGILLLVSPEMAGVLASGITRLQRSDEPSISDDDQTRVFGRPKRIVTSDATVLARQGSGTGLAVVANLVAAHEGRIVDADPNGPRSLECAVSIDTDRPGQLPRAVTSQFTIARWQWCSCCAPIRRPQVAGQ